MVRVSPENDTYALAGAFKKSQGVKEDTGVYPVSKYQPLKYALEDGDMARAQKEWAALTKGKTGEEIQKLARGFQASVNHPFTGRTKDFEQQFVASLKGKDEQTYEGAKLQRADVLSKFAMLAA